MLITPIQKDDFLDYLLGKSALGEYVEISLYDDELNFNENEVGALVRHFHQKGLIDDVMRPVVAYFVRLSVNAHDFKRIGQLH